MATSTTRPMDSSVCIFGRAGPLEVRLACDQADVDGALGLRASVFREGASDADAHDRWCDHLVVADMSVSGSPIVGTYRLIGSRAASAAGGFYSESEFDLRALKVMATDASPVRFLELGRSCVHPDYRSGPAMLLLWRGIAEYLVHRPADYLFGCASFPGIDPEMHAPALSWLAQARCGPTGRLVKAQPHRHVRMDMLPVAQVDPQQAWRQLPPLVRGYLQSGAEVGQGAVIDSDFGTVDVFMILATNALQLRHRRRFLAPARPQAVSG